MKKKKNYVQNIQIFCKKYFKSADKTIFFRISEEKFKCLKLISNNLLVLVIQKN